MSVVLQSVVRSAFFGDLDSNIVYLDHSPLHPRDKSDDEKGGCMTVCLRAGLTEKQKIAGIMRSEQDH